MGAEGYAAAGRCMFAVEGETHDVVSAMFAWTQGRENESYACGKSSDG